MCVFKYINILFVLIPTCAVNSEIKTVSHTAISSVQQNDMGLAKDVNKELSYENTQKTVVTNQADKVNQSPPQGPKKQTVGFMPGKINKHCAP